MRALFSSSWKIFCLFALFLSLFAGAHSETLDAKNRQDWKLIGGKGSWQHDPETDRDCLTLSNDGKSESTYWRFHYPFEPNALYKIVCQVKTSPGTRDGLFIVGTGFGIRGKTAHQEWTEHELMMTAPHKPEGAFIRLGQWEVNGTVWFRNVRVHRMLPVYRTLGEYVLGSGEIMADESYSVNLTFRETAMQSSRCLESFNAFFNSDRWDLRRNGDFVVYRHVLHPDAKDQLDGIATVQINYHTAGQLFIEASHDGRNWRKIGAMQSRGLASFQVPAELYPASQIFIRLHAKGLLARLQVNRYQYRARLRSNLPNFIGNTDFVQVEQHQDDIIVALSTLIDDDKSVRSTKIQVTNRSAKTRDVEIRLQNDEKEHTRQIALDPKEHSSLDLPIAIENAAHLKRIEIVSRDPSAVIFSARAAAEDARLQDEEHGVLLSENDGVSLWWTDATRKITPDGAMRTNRGNGSVEIFAAKNEYEPFQLVIRPRKPLQRLVIQPRASSAQQRELPTDWIEIYQVGFVTISQPTDALGKRGKIADPLFPIQGPVDLNPDENQSFWVLLHVPPEAQAGDYWGELELRASDWLETVPLRLHVWDFRLPVETHLQSAIGLEPEMIRVYQRLSNDVQMRAVWTRYLDNFAQHRLSPYDPFALDPIKIQIDAARQRVLLDFSAFDRQAKRYLDSGAFNSFRLVLPDPSLNEAIANGPFRKGAAGYERILAEYFRQVESHLRQRNWLDNAFIYWIDEPEQNDYPLVVETMAKIHRAAPGLTRMLTEQPEPQLFGAVDLWCPVTSNFDLQGAFQRRNFGERFWWYICTIPKEPFAGLFIDHPAVELRTWIWQSWQYGLDGILIWSANYWTHDVREPEFHRQNPYLDPMSYKVGSNRINGDMDYWGNGDGRLLYPPPGCFNSTLPCLDNPINSLRWEMLREGMEDYEYFWLLRDLVTRLESAGVASDRLPKAKELLIVPLEVSRSLTQFSKSPVPLYRHRRAMAEMIQVLSRL